MKLKRIKTISTAAFFALVFLLGMLPQTVYPQYQFYFGKNKVMKHPFDWKYIETSHFNIYYYTTNENLVKKITKAAELAYKKISDYLNIKVDQKIPMIFYSTHIDFEQTNIAGYVPPEALAFAESTTYRVVIQGDAPFDELTHTITHELGHIFEYEIMGEKAKYFSPPLWVVEGFSEFIAGEWGQFSLLTVRDMVLSGRTPQMGKSGDLETPYYNSRIVPYDFGHMIYEFLDQKFGKTGIKKLLYSLKGGPILQLSGQHNILKVLGFTPKTFNYEFGKYVRNRFRAFFSKENPEDYSYMIGPDFPYAYSFSHQVSPSGELLAVLTINVKNYGIEIILISMKDGKIIKKITPGFSKKYDNISINFDPTDGVSFSWNQKSNQIAFFARKELDNYLIVYDILNGNMLKRIKTKDIQAPSSPKYHPTENKIYFVGQESTKSFIYCLDLGTDVITKVTNGLLYIRGIDISADGERIAFSAKIDKHYKLYYGTLNNPEKAKQITFGTYNDITPAFSLDGRYIYYSSDELESYNICSIDLQEKKFARYTDVMTGNFFPVEVPGEKNQVVISSYIVNTFSLYKKDTSKPLEERNIEFGDIDEASILKKEAEAQDLTKFDEEAKFEFKFKGKYKPLKKLYIKSLPPLSISIGTDGSFWGYSYLTLTDLMGDKEFSFMASSYYGYRSYNLSYLNQRSKWQLYAYLFTFKDAYYYSDYSGISYELTLRSMYGGEIGVFRPFNRSYRLEATAALYHQDENYAEMILGPDNPYFRTGWVLPLRLSLVGETTRFSPNYVGPNRGHTFKLTFEKYMKVGSKFLGSYSFEGEARKYMHLDNNTLLAFRLYGYKSGGKNPMLNWTGGNNTLRAGEYRGLIGNNIFLFNAEFRFPLASYALTPLGAIGPIRGVIFFDFGGVWLSGDKFKVFEKYGEKKRLRLKDAISSYGFGLEFIMFGYPMHLEWTWRTDFTRRDYQGVNFWIGYDF